MHVKAVRLRRDMNLRMTANLGDQFEAKGRLAACWSLNQPQGTLDTVMLPLVHFEDIEHDAACTATQPLSLDSIMPEPYGYLKHISWSFFLFPSLSFS